jgi:aspartyl-tRNA(Asn)/glutamyl-tRNA(Gln) amidotransferase subunit C
VSTVLTEADVARVAALAHLALTPEETRLFTTQLASILEYARAVQAVDTSGVPATAHVHAGQRSERDDVPHDGIPTARALAHAPDPAPDRGLFRVPRVID